MKEFLLGIIDVLLNFFKFFVFGVSVVVSITVAYVYPTVLVGAIVFALIASIVKIVNNKTIK